MKFLLGRDGSSAVVSLTPRMPSVAHAMKEVVRELVVPTFDDVYDAHFTFVWRVLRTFGVRDEALEDAAQDVFVVVHRRLPEFEGRAAITTWLFEIARRVAGTHRRRDGRTEPLADEPAGSSDTFAALARAQAVATVMSILDTMDEDKRVVFAPRRASSRCRSPRSRSCSTSTSTPHTRASGWLAKPSRRPWREAPR